MIVRSSLALLFVTSSIAFAQQSQDAPPVDFKQMLHELDQIQSKSSASVQGRQQKVLSDFNNAAASGSRSVDLYEQAVRATRFAGQTLQQTQFQEWKKKESAKLRSHEMQTAAQLHLQYLGLTLRHAWGAPVEELLPTLFQYTNQVGMLMDDTAKRSLYVQQDLLRKGINESVFVNWYGIQSDLPAAKKWELVPMNVNGIYEKTILPYLRSQKDTRIIQYWDLRIQREGKQAEEGKRTFEIEQFNLVTKPNLLWRRAQDYLVIGQRNRAIGEMFAIVRGFPDHPETLARIAEIQKLAKPPAPKVPPAPEAPATPPADVSEAPETPKAPSAPAPEAAAGA